MYSYRKKPVVIEAWPWHGEWPLNSPPTWLSEAVERGTVWFRRNDSGKPRLVIRTLEGDHETCLDDYVIQGVKGELYPCRWDIFEMTYEPVLDEEGN